MIKRKGNNFKNKFSRSNKNLKSMKTTGRLLKKFEYLKKMK